MRAFFKPYFLLSFSRASRVSMPAFLRLPAELGVELDQAPGDAEAERAGLAGDAAPVDGRVDVVALGRTGDAQRLGGERAVGLGGEVVLERPLVDRDGAFTGAQAHTGDGTLAAAGRLDEWLCHKAAVLRG